MSLALRLLDGVEGTVQPLSAPSTRPDGPQGRDLDNPGLTHRKPWMGRGGTHQSHQAIAPEKVTSGVSGTSAFFLS